MTSSEAQCAWYPAKSMTVTHELSHWIYLLIVVIVFGQTILKWMD